MTMTLAGELAVALAKAQASFGSVKRDKTVTVQKRTGGSYSFSYAPLESILDAVRQPLADNGLVVLQVLDDGALFTTLLHESGAQVTGRVALPNPEDIQSYGSAITYLRRYAIQALLGIAAEDDDDGNRAAGNQAEPKESHVEGGERIDLIGIDTLSGKIAKGGSERYQCEWRETPSGWVIGFAVKGGDKSYPQVGIMGDIAAALYLAGGDLIGQHVRLRGRFYRVSAPGRTAFVRVIVGQGADDFIETDDWRIPPAAEEPVEAPNISMGLTDEEKAAIAGGLT